MTPQEMLRYRLAGQLIAATRFTKPQELVSHLLAMQSQDFGMAKWAIGLRLGGSTDAEVEHVFNDGKILRTHLMRPTWHFVIPKDIRWLVELTAPRVKKIMAPYDKRLGLTPAIYKKSMDTFASVLAGGKQLTRTELRTELAKKKLPLEESRLSHILMHAELNCLICSGPRIGKQFTYMLFDERAPKAKPLGREESLAMIAKRYFTTRGPATMQDFMWWSGLAAADARSAIAMLPSSFKTVEIGGRKYVYDTRSAEATSGQFTFLVPDYDEYGIAYRDRSMLNPKEIKGQLRNGLAVFNHMIVVDGVFAGTWERVVKGKKITVRTDTIPLNKRQQQALKKAVEKYNAFVR